MRNTRVALVLHTCKIHVLHSCYTRVTHVLHTCKIHVLHTCVALLFVVVIVALWLCERKCHGERDRGL